jgi:ferrous iron transport protein A
MPTLDTLQQGESGVIVRIDADPQLKQRLRALGLTRGLEVKVEAWSLAKKTIEVCHHNNKLALRASEAQRIHVQPSGEA